jgi:hypothetical protein
VESVHEQLTDSKCQSDSGRLEDQSEITIIQFLTCERSFFGIPAGFFYFLPLKSPVHLQWEIGGG